MIVAIDGPAGSGKSSTAKALAERLGWVYLDTGAMYRAVALAFIRAGAHPSPHDANRVLEDLDLDLDYNENGLVVYLNGEEVTQAIREPHVGSMASKVSALSKVREQLVLQQRTIARAVTPPRGVVLDGRDIGTVVFPDADVKVYLTASVEARAQRRHQDLIDRGRTVSLEEVMADIEARDASDRSRTLAPLKRAEDAVEIDTTTCSFDEQVQRILALVEEQRAKGSVSSSSTTLH